jgi:sugar phosphate permease
MPVLADPAQAVLFFYTGTIFGDLSCGLLSQWLRSRKRALLIFLAGSFISIAWYLSSGAISPQALYLKGAVLGFFVGYWAVFVTTAAEQFGTNLRATVATSVPNFVRGLLPVMILVFRQLETITQSPLTAAWGMSGLLAVLVFSVLYFLPETFHKNLDYYD